MFGEMGLSASKFNNEFLDLELVSIVSNGNPETNKIYYPTYKNKPILINDYKSFFKSRVEGINIVWFNEKIKDNYLLSDYRLEKPDEKSLVYFEQKIKKRIPITATFLPSMRNFSNENIQSQNPTGFCFNFSTNLYNNKKNNLLLGAQLNIMSGTNSITNSNRSYSYVDIDPENYNY